LHQSHSGIKPIRIRHFRNYRSGICWKCGDSGLIFIDEKLMKFLWGILFEKEDNHSKDY
jgi:hypothetical protein